MCVTLPDQLGIYMGRRNNDVSVSEKGRALTATQLATATFSDVVQDIAYTFGMPSFSQLVFASTHFVLQQPQKKSCKKNTNK